MVGTDRIYPTERLPVVLASLGMSSHVSDMEIRKPDSEAIPIEVWGHPIHGARGETEYSLSVFADMSERQAREKTVADQAALLDLAHDAILVRDRDSRITYWNAGAERTYGYTRAEALGQISNEILRTRFPVPLADIEGVRPGTAAGRASLSTVAPTGGRSWSRAAGRHGTGPAGPC